MMVITLAWRHRFSLCPDGCTSGLNLCLEESYITVGKAIHIMIHGRFITSYSLVFPNFES